MSAHARWAAAYETLRAREGRGDPEDLAALPYPTQGPLAAQWAIRARTYERFLGAVVRPLARRRGDLRVLDLGAGNGWLCHRLRELGHEAVAVDVRLDGVDGLGAARVFPAPVRRLAASFEELPLRSRTFDVALFNAALHYAEELPRALAEAARAVRPGGLVAILDSPFYTHERDGHAMLAERDAATGRRFPDLADDLAAVRRVEFLTRARLARAAEPFGLAFRRRRVLYPLAYEIRPLKAWLSGARPSSRFDLWVAVAP